MQLSTETTARMTNHQSRCWLTAPSGLNGIPSTHKGWLSQVHSSTQSVVDQSQRPLLKLNLPAWLSGTMSAAMKRAAYPDVITSGSHDWCTGVAHASHKGSHTAGQQCQICAWAMAQGVLASKPVPATLRGLRSHLLRAKFDGQERLCTFRVPGAVLSVRWSSGRASNVAAGGSVCMLVLNTGAGQNISTGVALLTQL